MTTSTSCSAAPARRHGPARHLLLLTALLSALALLMPPPALAAGIVVTTANEGIAPGDGCSLREAIINANADNQSGSTECNAGSGADTITFAGDYTITLASALPDLAGTLSIDGTGRSVTVSGNNAVRVFSIQGGAVVTLSHLNIINGNAADYGGGIYNDGGTLTLSNSTLSGNSADRLGGGIQSNGTVTVSTSTFTGNSARELGGGIQNSGTLTIDTSTFTGNSGQEGGGIDSSDGSTLTISTSTFSSNSASFGGGIASRGARLTLSTSTFSGNSASFGGGIGNLGTLMAVVSNSTFSDNTANRGGGIRNTGILTVSNSTFSGNTAQEEGGGIFNESSATLGLRNSLIANSPSGGDCANEGTLDLNQNNLIEDGSCSPALSGDPLLSPLGSYGGATQTFALLPGSPAIDAGDSASCAAAPINSLDQRGIARPASCDIGTFESRGFILGNLSGTPQSTPITRAFAAPLELTVSSTFGEPVGPGGQVIFTAPSSGASITTSSPLTGTTTATGVVSQTVTANGVTGSYSVTATSRGAASQASFSLTNLKASSQVAVHSSANPSLPGRSVTFTAIITGITTPSGQVGFVIDGGVPITVTLAGGQASYTTSSLAVGSHSVVANYSGDSNHAPSSASLAGGQQVWRPLYLPLITYQDDTLIPPIAHRTERQR